MYYLKCDWQGAKEITVGTEIHLVCTGFESIPGKIKEFQTKSNLGYKFKILEVEALGNNQILFLVTSYEVGVQSGLQEVVSIAGNDYIINIPNFQVNTVIKKPDQKPYGPQGFLMAEAGWLVWTQLAIMSVILLSGIFLVIRKIWIRNQDQKYFIKLTEKNKKPIQELYQLTYRLKNEPIFEWQSQIKKEIHEAIGLYLNIPVYRLNEQQIKKILRQKLTDLQFSVYMQIQVLLAKSDETQRDFIQQKAIRWLENLEQVKQV